MPPTTANRTGRTRAPNKPATTESVLKNLNRNLEKLVDLLRQDTTRDPASQRRFVEAYTGLKVLVGRPDEILSDSHNAWNAIRETGRNYLRATGQATVAPQVPQKLNAAADGPNGDDGGEFDIDTDAGF